MHIEIEPQTSHLHIVAKGSFKHGGLGEMFGEIFASSSKHRLYKILIDIRQLKGEISVLARHDAGEIVATLQREPVRLAIVGTSEQMLPDRFFENVANNRWVLTKVSTDLAEALEWLNQGSAKQPETPTS